MFRDREDAARKLAARLKSRQLHDPVILAIPRGGLLIGAVLARTLDADLDVVLSRKLRAPEQPELAIGAIAEDGRVWLNDEVCDRLDIDGGYLKHERRQQLAEIGRRKALFRAIKPPVPLAGRSVIVTDDGIATGSTMLAALRIIRTQEPREIIVAVPVASPSRLVEVQRLADDVVCLLRPEFFWAIGQFYENFTQVTDEEARAAFETSRPTFEPHSP
jgi:predicted phosphoribosyltransferase